MEFKENTEKIWMENEEGKIIAYVEFPKINGTANVMHTVVDSSLRGQGVAGRLMEALVEKMEKEDRKLELTCSYAVDWFNKNREHENVLADAEKEYAKAINKG
ncbi:MAG: GNAT family N-acetyltransferase [Catonella sp.]|uniref:GNAT family N-acetyltransferase n=1 Tax=Catonella sp. TaxID=2382125 RepID=UPI003FA11245